jgi:hypothetical protein
MIEGELNWDWPQICCVLMWRLAPAGVTVSRADLHALPMELVLIVRREPSLIAFTWVTVEEAQRLRGVIALLARTPDDWAGVEPVMGRWQKLSSVLLWKLAKDGVTLTPNDLEALPKDRVLLAEGHADDIEYRFVPRPEAERIRKRESDSEGRNVLEVL